LNGRYYLAYEGFITAAVMYLIIVLIVARGFRLWEKHWLKHLYPLDAVDAKPKKGAASIRI
jgi:arginine/ornithine transport system permease protein